MMLTQRQVQCGAASMLLKRYGAAAADVAAARVRALATTGDEAGARMWKEIGNCIAQMSVAEFQN